MSMRVNKSRRMRWTGHVSHMGETRNAYNVYVGKQGKRPFIRPGYSWEDNIRMDLREIRWEGVGIHVAQDRDQWWLL
jgi:hypothetical protein